MEALRAGRTVAHFNGMLCGHEWMLELLMANLVEVRVNEAEDGRTFLQLENRGPVRLTAEIEAMPVDPVALGSYQKVLVGLRRRPDRVTIAWKNLYTRPTSNFATSHPLAAVAQ
jgi:hypothetical protein